ncbi:hypothetical protein EV702DRAFT_1041963 [Suillus placidus]|uniref:Uncharacterized protein n=1 Tax=Suillus placidus TaxID=48579 RepID=A0A9P7A2W1_9AGAM|nr:hypothetical protein EV702DRAFT_1041963 [Suillus placidus]
MNRQHRTLPQLLGLLGTDEEDQFDMEEDNVLPPPIVAPVPPLHMDEGNIISPPTVAPIPPLVIIHVPVGKWVDMDKLLDPEDLNLLSEIMDIPQEVCSMLLPSDDNLPVKELLDFKLPDINTGCFIQTGASCFHQACPDKDLDLARDIPPKSWVYSLQESLNDAIWDGKRLILHLQFKDKLLPRYSGRCYMCCTRLRQHGLIQIHG